MNETRRGKSIQVGENTHWLHQEHEGMEVLEPRRVSQQRYLDAVRARLHMPFQLAMNKDGEILTVTLGWDQFVTLTSHLFAKPADLSHRSDYLLDGDDGMGNVYHTVCNRTSSGYFLNLGRNVGLQDALDWIDQHELDCPKRDSHG